MEGGYVPCQYVHHVVANATLKGTIDELTPWYGHYRRALINLRPRTEYETFGHPVACELWNNGDAKFAIRKADLQVL